MADAFERMADCAMEPADLERLSRWGRDVTGRGACRHPDGAAGFVAGALRTFADEVEAHRRGHCRGADLGVLPVTGRR
jgi:NADH:ubiquinone oxidoreductase subunit F (NADH-binding)